MNNKIKKNVIEGIFTQFGKLVEQDLMSDNVGESLIESYWSFCNTLKENAGTSSGFTGLSEYLFLIAIKKYLEKVRGIEFRIVQGEGGLYSYQTDNLVITHDRAVKDFLDTSLKQRPDILILKKEGEEYKIVAIFQIKTYLANPRILDREFKKIDDLVKSIKYTPLVFFIFFMPSKKNFDKHQNFFEKYGGRAHYICRDYDKHSTTFKRALNALDKELR